MKKTVIFDLGGVLVDWNPRYFYRAVFNDDNRMEDFLARCCNSQWILKMDAGMSVKENIALAQKSCPEYAKEIALYDEGWHHMFGPIFQGTVEILKELKQKGYKLYALTNWSAEKFPWAKENFKSYLALATAVRYAKDLCNEPASYLTPDVFAADIKRLEYLGLDVKVLDADALKVEGFGLVEAVGKGAAESPRVVVVSWRGNRQKKAYDMGFVGKGVCFDAGGLSLKNNAGMREMKMDMSGAAAVVAVMKAAALQRVRKNLIAVVGLAENMPGAAAMKIGDVYASFGGKTVEITNADAEGRLIVADCLSFLQKSYPVKKIVDMATLGAFSCVLSNAYAALVANDDKLAKQLLAAGERCGENLWRMPLDRRYEKMLASPVADMCNIETEGRVSIVSAVFLSRFIEKGVKWAHIDISGVSHSKTGLASGFGVRLLNELIKEI